MEYNNIPKEKFRFADSSRKTGDKKFDTKQMSYAKDVFRRFCKNKSSVVAAFIIFFLVAFAILVPMFFENDFSRALTDNMTMQYIKMSPRNELFLGTGFWDGSTTEVVNENTYNTLRAMEIETGETIIHKVIEGPYEEVNIVGNKEEITIKYKIRYDSYYAKGMTYVDLDEKEFARLQQWQIDNDTQVIYPWVNSSLSIKGTFGKETPLIAASVKDKPNIWYATDSSGNPKVDPETGEFTSCYATNLQSGKDYNYKSTSKRYSAPYYVYNSLRIDGDPAKETGDQTTEGAYIYALVSPMINPSDPNGEPLAISYRVRVSLYTYFQFRYGTEPSFLFGTDDLGQDIFTRLAQGARFSLILAICISAVNLFIGAIYGAIEGFYGGVTDLVMERISDVLGGMPSMVVMSLFQLHLASKVGPIWSMVFAFILTGWLGMAARTRMQFYRFKRQEYVLSARTLGASDARLIFKHIFPNAMGTLITGSILMIPGVIFSESSLTYLGIVNLEGSTTTSVGTLLSNGSGMLRTHPHIILFPALFVSLLEISFNLFGNGLRDAFNPSLKGVED